MLDLTDVSYMDSSRLGALVGLYVSAKRAGKQLKLINLSDRVRDMLRVTNLLSVFDMANIYNQLLAATRFLPLPELSYAGRYMDQAAGVELRLAT